MLLYGEIMVYRCVCSECFFIIIEFLINLFINKWFLSFSLSNGGLNFLFFNSFIIFVYFEFYLEVFVKIILVIFLALRRRYLFSSVFNIAIFL